MRKTVIIGLSNYYIIDMDEFDLHTEVLFHRAEDLNLKPEIKEQFYLGKLFLTNNYVVLQISDYFTIAYLPDDINNYQVSIIRKYVDEYSKYGMVTSDSDRKYHTMNYYDFLELIHNMNNCEDNIIRK